MGNIWAISESAAFLISSKTFHVSMKQQLIQNGLLHGPIQGIAAWISRRNILVLGSEYGDLCAKRRNSSCNIRCFDSFLPESPLRKHDGRQYADGCDTNQNFPHRKSVRGPPASENRVPKWICSGALKSTESYLPLMHLIGRWIKQIYAMQTKRHYRTCNW